MNPGSDQNLPTTHGWHPDVRRALDNLLEVPAEDGAVAVFDFDNTCILGDIGELYAHYLVETMRYRYDLAAFWELIHVEDGRRRLQKLTEEALQIAPEQRSSVPVYRDYLAEMAGLYGRRLRRAGKRDCYEWAVRLHVGLSEAEMNAWSVEAVRRELNEPRRVDKFETKEGREVRVARGIRPFGEIRELIADLGEAGYEVWIVSATNIWTVRQLAPLFGVPPQRVLGNRVTVDGEILSAETDKPALFREGKVEIIERVIGRRPAFVAGDSVTDYEMLCHAEELGLVIDCGDELLRKEAKSRGWAVQPQAMLTGAEPEPGDLALVGADSRGQT